ncbi:hypothetical protein [Thiolinea disciformis]|uniref:hypothetical protein n=1 Tax=Thiolinea disciformis TaxID=125614 RepID=UPI00035CD680|nr:hypothetical protein [Thiolinea disciformis]
MINSAEHYSPSHFAYDYYRSYPNSYRSRHYWPVGFDWPVPPRYMDSMWDQLIYGHRPVWNPRGQGLGPNLNLSEEEKMRLTQAMNQGRFFVGANTPTILDVYDTDRSRSLTPGDSARVSTHRLTGGNSESTVRLSADTIRRARSYVEG